MRRRFAPLALLIALSLPPAPARAEDPWDADAPDPAAITEALKRTQADAEAAGEPADEAARVRKDALSRRVALLTELAGMLPSGPPRDPPPRRIEAQIATRRAEIDALLRQPVALDDVRPRTSAELDSYAAAREAAQSTLAAAQQAHVEARERRTRLEREIQRILPERATALQAEFAAPLGAAAAAHEALLRGNTRLELRTVALRTARAKTELERLTAQMPLIQAEVDLARMRAERAQVRYLHAVDAARAELLAVAERERAEAEAAGQAAEADTDPVRRLRRRIRAERDLVRAEAQADAAREAELEARSRAAELARDAAGQERTRIAERLASGDRAEIAGLLIEVRRRARRQLDALVGRRLPELRREIQQTQGTRSQVMERLWVLDVPEEESTELAHLVAEIRRAAPARETEARIVFGLTVRGQDGLVGALRKRLEVLGGNLERLESLRRATEARIGALKDLSAFVLSRLIWVRSDPVLSPAILTSAAADVPQVAQVAAGPDLGGPVVAWYGEAPVSRGLMSLLVVLGFCGLLVTTRKLRRTMPHAAPKHMPLPAVRATWSAIWRSALLPGYLVIAVLLFRALGAPRAAGLVVGDAVLLTTALWFAHRLTWRLFREGGIATGEYGMRPVLARALGSASRWVLLGAIALAVPAALLARPPFELVGLPRVLQAAFVIVVALAFTRLVRPSGPFQRVLGENAPFWRRVTSFLAPLAILGLFGIVVMEILGYREGARFFLSGALQTAAFLFLLLGLHQLAKRFIRALADRVRRRAARESGRAEAAAMSETVISQLSQVALAVLVITALFLLGDVWDLDTQVASLLADIELFQLSDDVALTLWDVLKAIAFVVFAHFISRNLGAVLDSVVFPTVGATDVGSRYVTLSLLRYAILIFGYGAALLTLHFSFASIGWALAAISFGLGFGMQEIVANFVSGLILLLERPIRVGDVISVGNTSGIVEQITVRSTVVTNWDRQQIIVPNKRLITENVTNWTRNDLVVRRKLTVGVAYGSDVAKVLEILEEVAAAEPAVRKDPAPRILFEGFGDSSLDFELWIFTVYDQGLLVRSRLHAEIDRRFREAGITIPFPQRDVHVHDPRPSGPDTECG